MKVLDVTHRQWLYCNLQVHNHQAGAYANQRKEELQLAIEETMCRELEGLDEEDRCLVEVKLEDLDETSGEDREYWLLAYQAELESERQGIDGKGRVDGGVEEWLKHFSCTITCTSRLIAFNDCYFPDFSGRRAPSPVVLITTLFSLYTLRVRKLLDSLGRNLIANFLRYSVLRHKRTWFQ